MGPRPESIAVRRRQDLEAIMKSAYNYTAVETHKQKLYIPYIGIELNGWGWYS